MPSSTQEASDLTVAVKVDYVRKACDIPPSVMAKLLGVSRTQYWRWVNGQSAPRQNKLQLLKATALAMLAALRNNELPLVAYKKSPEQLALEAREVLLRYRSQA